MSHTGGGLAVFVRWPEPGRSMPALIPHIGADAAAEVEGAFIADVVTRIRLHPLISIVYADQREKPFRDLLTGTEVRLQRERDEGRRLTACLSDLLAAHGKAVIVGHRVPDLHPRIVEGVFQVLERREAVIGPTENGGIYLMGLRVACDALRSVRWSAEGAAVAMLDAFRSEGLDYGFFPTRRDVETCDDLSDLRGRLRPETNPFTCAVLDGLRLDAGLKAPASGGFRGRSEAAGCV